MKVAIIDCEVNKEILNTAFLDRIDELKIRSMVCGEQRNGKRMEHASLVMSVLQKYAITSIQYYVYEIMDSMNKGTCENIMNALDDIIDRKISIVILSLVVNNMEKMREFQKLCHKAKENNVLIFAAANNRVGMDSFPASFSNVIGVNRGCIINAPYYSYVGGEIQLIGDCTPEFLEIKDGRYRIFGGTSKAVPKLIGTIQKGILEGANTFILMEEYLKENCLDYSKIELEEATYKDIKLENEKLLQKIVEVINENYKKRVLDFNILRKRDQSIESIIKSEEIDRILLQLFDYFHIDVQLEELNYWEFATIHRICKCIDDRKG